MPARPTGVQRLLPVVAAPSRHGFCPAAVIRMHSPLPTRRPVSGEQLTLAALRIAAATCRSAICEGEHVLSTRCRLLQTKKADTQHLALGRTLLLHNGPGSQFTAKLCAINESSRVL